MIDTASLSISEIETLGVVVMSQLNALTTLYTTAESDVLDRAVVAQADDVYATYFANRKNVIESLGTLEQAQQNLQGKIDDLSETEVSSQQSVDVSVLDEELATRQAAFSAAIAATAKQASEAATNIAVAEASLGNIQAPFAGTVARVQAEIGEYKIAGEPLFTLHGSGGRELRVNVPLTLSSQLMVGGVLLVQGEIAGSIDRISPTASGHNVEVFV
jgi:multidrug efflux pump subunit AcrA (membrane-fusion protein)